MRRQSFPTVRLSYSLANLNYQIASVGSRKDGIKSLSFNSIQDFSSCDADVARSGTRYAAQKRSGNPIRRRVGREYSRHRCFLRPIRQQASLAKSNTFIPQAFSATERRQLRAHGNCQVRRIGSRTLDNARHQNSGMITIVHQNDLVTLAGKAGIWKVLTQVNGARADICRNDAQDTRVITAPLTRVTIIQRAGSPDYNY
jgi:hypothetical protein